MKFAEKLNEYISLIDCSGKEFAKASELSEVVISRYRSGEREPQKDEQIDKLASAIEKLAREKNIDGLSYNEIKNEFDKLMHNKSEEFTGFAKRFSELIDVLQINVKDLSGFTCFETSYIYRIKSGQRKPNDLNTFADKVCQYIIANYSTEECRLQVANLIGVDQSCLEDNNVYATSLKGWLCNYVAESTDPQMESFLKKLEEFNLNEYIRSIHFDELKVPNIPFYRPSTKNYYGVNEMRKGELDFFKGVVLSKSREDVFMCSDMPMYDMAEDMDFNKKWMFGIAMCIKKGLHLNIIHNVDRPFNEMMLGLEAWLPIYMTGQVSPYCLPNVDTSIYHHFNYVSGTVALTGECISGCHDKGKYYLTCNKEEVAYFREKAGNLLAKANPLMEIYNSEDKKKILAFIRQTSDMHGNRTNIYYAPPLYTIPDELLDDILNNRDANVDSVTKSEIKKYASLLKNITQNILSKDKISDSLPVITKEEFEKHPVHLSIDGLFYENEISYTYDQYLAHIEACKKYEVQNPNYVLTITEKCAFRNIQIRILENNYVHISKNKAPSIHFIIKHPKLVTALTNFVPLAQN